jgi:thiamine biosynthesis lipoprotein
MAGYQVSKRSWRALGTSLHVLTTTETALADATRVVRDLLDDVDLAYSRFRNDSELIRLNGSAGRRVVVSPLLGMAIEVGLRAARITKGAVDPTIGKALRLAGYDDDFTRIAAHDQRPVRLQARPIPGWQAIHYDRSSRTVLIPAGVDLDFGSTGKALAADLAATSVSQTVGPAVGILVSLGGDIATAGPPPDGGWRILVAEDSNLPPESEGETICLHRGGLATSSTTIRRWTRQGLVMHHIIDPETGLPAGGPWRTVTVAAATCVDANIASTAAIVRGPRAIEWLVGHRLPARLVETDGTIHYIGEWPVPEKAVA